MKTTIISLWNADQWKYIRYPHNWFKIGRTNHDVLTLTIFGFTIFFM